MGFPVYNSIYSDRLGAHHTYGGQTHLQRLNRARQHTRLQQASDPCCLLRCMVNWRAKKIRQLKFLHFKSIVALYLYIYTHYLYATSSQVLKLAPLLFFSCLASTLTKGIRKWHIVPLLRPLLGNTSRACPRSYKRLVNAVTLVPALMRWPASCHDPKTATNWQPTHQANREFWKKRERIWCCSFHLEWI